MDYKEKLHIAIMSKSAKYHSMLCELLHNKHVMVKDRDIETFPVYARFFGVSVNGGALSNEGDGQWFYID